jgi:peptidoglycan/xylan/chitin deacetylase (PgdA/CDA1 family)
MPRLGVRPIAQAAARGHAIGYHCGHHVRHPERSRDEVRREARGDLEALRAVGVEPRSWRTPWGDLAPWSAALAAELGLELWRWSDDTEDWGGRSADVMLAGLRETIGPGSVVLMHDGLGPGARRTGCGQTVELLEPLIALLSGRELQTGVIDD